MSVNDCPACGASDCTPGTCPGQMLAADTDPRDRALRAALRALSAVASGSWDHTMLSAALGTVAEALGVELTFDRPKPTPKPAPDRKRRWFS